MKSDAHKEIVRHSRGLKGTKVVVTSTSQSTITRPTVRAHNLDSATAQSATLFRWAAPERSLPAQIREYRQAALRDTPCARQIAAGWIFHVGARSPMPVVDPKSSPQLSAAFLRPTSTAATRANNFKATDVASVSKVIHTDNQLQAGQFGKTAYTGWIRTNRRPMR
jgi:hypothetical protein